MKPHPIRTRAVSLLTALVLLTGLLAGCGRDATAEELVGSWRLIQYTAEGKTYTEAELSQIGVYITMTLQSDGTGVIRTNSETNPLTWDSRSVVVKGASSSILLKDGQLYVSDASGDMVFRKGDYTRSLSPLHPVIINGDDTSSGTAAPDDPVASQSLPQDGGQGDSDAFPASDWDAYSDDKVSFYVPKGWKVSTGSTGNMLNYSVYNPNVEGMGWQYMSGPVPVSQNADESDRAMGAIVMKDGTAAAYFTGMFAASRTVTRFDVKRQKDLGASSLSSLGNELDHAALYATWTQNGSEGEGVYHAVVNGAFLDTSAAKDGWYYVYDTVVMTAPEGQLADSVRTMAASLASMELTQAYIQSIEVYTYLPVDYAGNFRRSMQTAVQGLTAVAPAA